MTATQTAAEALRFPLARSPIYLLPLLVGASSVASLLLYFYGFVAMGSSVTLLLLGAASLLGATVAWARLTGRVELTGRIVSGLWAGGLATLAYDLVRVPIAQADVPVFKAISYFGTTIMGRAAPDVVTELVGWSYHLSNGIGFGLMYTVLVARPRWWTAVVWGLGLEGAMLLTPYAEVFGYRRTGSFLALTIGSHVTYGAVLYLALRYWLGGRSFASRVVHNGAKLALIFALAPIGVGAIGADFFEQHGARIATSPPPYIGPHLYTTWNVMEPDRLAGMWMLKRFEDPEARFHYIEPFSSIRFGTPFDIPEASLRRSGARSVTEVLSEGRRDNDDKLAFLATVAHLFEIAPWRLPSEPAAERFGHEMMALSNRCDAQDLTPCVERVFDFLDDWYGTSQ